jgi:hypothetical protein
VVAKSYEPADIKVGLAEGGRILGIFIASRRTADDVDHVAYFRTDFGRGFLPFRSFRGKSDRVYKSVDSLLGLIRDDFEYTGEISIFLAGDKALRRRFKSLLPAERGALAQEDVALSFEPPGSNAGRAGEPGPSSWDDQPG